MSVSLLWKPSQSSRGNFVGYLWNLLKKLEDSASKTSTYVPMKRSQVMKSIVSSMK